MAATKTKTRSSNARSKQKRGAGSSRSASNGKIDLANGLDKVKLPLVAGGAALAGLAGGTVLGRGRRRKSRLSNLPRPGGRSNGWVKKVRDQIK